MRSVDKPAASRIACHSLSTFAGSPQDDPAQAASYCNREVFRVSRMRGRSAMSLRERRSFFTADAGLHRPRASS